MISAWSFVFVLVMVINQKCTATPVRSVSAELEARDTISTEHRLLHCYTKRCEQSFNRPPYHQTAPVTCGDTGLAPPCFATRRKGPPKTHQTAPITCGDTGLAPPCF
ncbi:hypothetical protein MJO28_004159 [Puccinia striiformis f. sp. tritici]|uniref:Uncharacterized protein n=1 Tax=Puccinia striiformis f. sp. tritici TaxID=168172 RepID=A0ACC0EN58_9BASI|nr:hypothetical protein Pst134EA_007243 [Puccinia striiformis f. sp. tritici]KAH9460194.1 hypothetical protein Pst134EB_008381 [Puccinia striiformis f. sp. tritici]KAH9469973.1 hypothetical protein Pst134EA_007243 [Puccinia striiformis f. sp. tritici]KAI7957064.1 hypothetical protein MJO28_004159 [Puccinia striiformis f. sp. tritici]KAI9599859.1 hypothetical protein KEM48_010254 [Puccinia striiformis f. sp. tritici PST-130]